MRDFFLQFDVMAFVPHAKGLWEQALGIWIAGGWGMVAIALTALMLFALGTRMQLKLVSKMKNRVRERTWRRWISHPEQRRGPIGELLDYVTGGATVHDVTVLFEELRNAEVAPFERDLRFMQVCISAAPLFGLLGTVTGMLSTFQALAGGSGGDETMGLVAKGISEALITTETGLVVALPGLFFQYHLARRIEGYKAFLAHIETVCTQQIYRHTHRIEKPDPPAAPPSVQPGAAGLPVMGVS